MRLLSIPEKIIKRSRFGCVSAQILFVVIITKGSGDNAK